MCLLTQIMLQSSAAQVLIRLLKLVWIVSHAPVAGFRILHLLHIKVLLHLIGVIIKVLVAAMLARGIILGDTHLVGLILVV